MKPLNMIVAVATNGVIGRDGKLPWHIPEDLKRFKKLTTGHAIIMGRKTYESIGRPLPNRHNVVVTSTLNSLEGCTIVRSLQDAIEYARYSYMGDMTPFVIGGARIFEEALPLTTRIYRTSIDRPVEGDVFMPGYTDKGWNLVEAVVGEEPGVMFVTLDRKVT